MWTVESFNVFDDATVHVELLSAQVTVTVPGEIVVYLRAFDQLARLAVYGAEARSLISRAISDLSLIASQVSASLFRYLQAFRQARTTPRHCRAVLGGHPRQRRGA